MGIHITRVPRIVRNTTGRESAAFSYDHTNNKKNILVSGVIQLSPPESRYGYSRVAPTEELVILTSDDSAHQQLPKYLRACSLIDEGERLAETVNKHVDKRNLDKGTYEEPSAMGGLGVSILVSIVLSIVLSFALSLTILSWLGISEEARMDMMMFLIVMLPIAAVAGIFLSRYEKSRFEREHQGKFWVVENWGDDDSLITARDNISPEILSMVEQSLNPRNSLPMDDRIHALEIGRVAHHHPELFSEGSAGSLVSKQESDGFRAAYRVDHWRKQMDNIDRDNQ